MAFLGFPDPFPDSRTIWLFKQRMAETGKDKMIWSELQRQLDAMGLQVSLTSVSESLDEVETLSMERYKMQHLSRQILVHQRNLAVRVLKPDGVEMELGQRKEMSLILVISCIKKPISITA